MEVDLVWVGLALSDFLLRKFKENKLLLNFIFLDCSWFAKEFKVTLQSGGSMSLKEFGFDIKDMRMRWGGWVFLRKIKMFISNFFHRVLQLYTLLNASYRCQQDMIFLIYKILICIHVSCWTCMSTYRSKICIVCLVIGVRPFTERTLVQILLQIDGCWVNIALGLHIYCDYYSLSYSVHMKLGIHCTSLG